MALEQELATYQEKMAELLPNEGKFVLIHGSDVVDVYGTYEDAVKEGYQKFNLEPFLVTAVLNGTGLIGRVPENKGFGGDVKPFSGGGFLF